MLRTRQNGIPAYKRIQGIILKRIESGQLKPGDEVSSERELARIHRVSLMTARHALAELEREGMVERRRGAGTFVAPPKIHFNRLMSYTELMAGRSLTSRSKLISCRQWKTNRRSPLVSHFPMVDACCVSSAFARAAKSHSPLRSVTCRLNHFQA